jgi:SAM-dependent methyltransferase
VLAPVCVFLLYDWHRTQQRLALEKIAKIDDVVTARSELALNALLFPGTMVAICGLVVIAIGNAIWGRNDLWLGVLPVALSMLVILILWRLYELIPGFVSQLSRTEKDERRRLHNLSRAWVVEDDPVRDRLPSTTAILDALDLRAGMHVADVGAGGGYFALKMAERVGPSGLVTATDISDDFVARLRLQAQERGLRHLQVMLVDTQRPLPVSQQVDRILLADVYLFNLANEAQGRAWLEQFAAALRPGGKLVVCNEFVHETGWVAAPQWPPLATSQPDAETVIQWAAPSCELVAEIPLPRSPQARPLAEHERPGYLIVLKRPD